MKKFIAVLLTFAIIFTLGIPAFAAEEGTAEDTVITQELHEDVETPAITEEEIKDILDSEEVREELEENGVDVDELEEGIDNGDIEFVEVEEDYLPENLKNLNFFELYGASVLTIITQGTNLITDGLFLVSLAPASLLLWVIPPVGAAYTIAGIPIALVSVLGGVVMIIASPVAGLVMTAVIKSE